MRLVLFSLALTGCSASRVTTTTAAPEVPSPAAVSTPRLDGIEAAIDLDGQLVGPLRRGESATVAIMFASWCGPSRTEMPVIATLRSRHPELRVLGINYRAHEEYDGRGSAAAVRAFLAEEAPWLRVVPADEALWASLGAPPKIPTIYIFDREGAFVRAFDRRTDPIPSLAELEAALPR